MVRSICKCKKVVGKKIKNNKSLLLIIVILVIVFKVSGQSSDTFNTNIKNNEIWIDFYPHYYIDEKLEYYGDMGYRTIAGEQSWNRIYARPSVKYHFNFLWEAHAGLGFFYIFLKNKDFNRFEFTPWQGVQLNWPNFGYIDFKNLVRIEERFSFLTKNGSSSFGARLRYKLSAKLKLPDSETLKHWFIPVYGELFIPVFDNIDAFFSNQKRAGIGIGHSKGDWNLQLLYNWQSARINSSEDFSFNDNAFQLKVKKIWRKRKKRVKQ